LAREISDNYLGTRPASAALEIDGDVTPVLVQRRRSVPGVSEAEARDVVIARARVGDDWRRMLLFVVDDFDHLRLNTFRSEAGAWPPPAGTMLVERSAVSMLTADMGQTVVIKTPRGVPTPVPITGRVYDPGLGPHGRSDRATGTSREPPWLCWASRPRSESYESSSKAALWMPMTSRSKRRSWQGTLRLPEPWCARSACRPRRSIRTNAR
jgi:hypothetical protein